MLRLNVSKFGETFDMATPSQAPQGEGVETRHSPSRTDEGIVQTTNNIVGSENYSGKKIPPVMGSNPSGSTKFW